MCVCRSGFLAFSEDVPSSNSEEEGEWFMKTTPILSSTLIMTEEDEVRVRSVSNGSQQIGRFEVMMVTEEGEAGGTPQETSNLL